MVLAGGRNGNLLEELLREEGLDPEILPIENPTRQKFTVLDESSEVQYRFVMPGPVVISEELKEVETRIVTTSPRPDFLVSSGSLPKGVRVDFYVRVIRAAKKAERK